MALRSLLATLLSAVAFAFTVNAAVSGEVQAATPAKSVLVLSVGWDAGPSMGAAPSSLPAGEIGSWWRTRVDSFLVDMSRGQFGGLNVHPDVNEVTIAAPASTAAAANACTADSFFDEVAQKADTAARAQGVDPAAFDVVAYYWSPVCNDSTSRLLKSRRVGSKVFFQGFDQTAPFRELARVLGTGSADALNCLTPAGQRVSYSSLCIASAAGDTWDARGAGLGVFSAPGLDQLGWLPRKATAQACDTCELSTSLKPLGSEPEGGTQAIVFQDGTDPQGRPVSFWVEFRQHTELDSLPWNRPNDAQDGVVIHRQVAGSPDSQLIDVSPGDSFKSAALQLGQTWENPRGLMQVEYARDGSEGAVIVTVRPRGAKVPSVLGYSQAEATTELSRVGLTIQVQQVVDRTCTHLGDVMAQSPAPGAYRLPRAQVTISVGVKDPNVACPAPGKRVLVLNVAWEAGNGTDESPAVPTLPILAKLRSAVNDFYTGSSYGHHNGFQFVSAGDPLTIEPPTRPAEGICKDSSLQPTVAQRARAAARARGVAVDGFDHYLYVVSTAPCGDFAGQQSGNEVFMQGDNPQVFTHEFGHILGLGHANDIVCRDAGGNLVPLSGSCERHEYSDPYDAMGNLSDGGFSAGHLAQLGWLDGGRQETLAECDCTVTRTLTPLADQSSGLHALKLVDQGRTFWLEYRQRVGVDAGADSGVDNEGAGLVVHLEAAPVPPMVGNQFVLRMNDGHTPLLPGQTWLNPLGLRTIRVNSMDSGALSVTVGSQFVSVPNVNGMTITAAGDAIRAAGLQVAGQASQIDPTCNLVGKVMGTNPGSGQRVRLNTGVTLNVGAKSPTLPCK